MLCMLGCSQLLTAQQFSAGIHAGIATGTPLGKVPEGATGAPGIGPAAGIFLAYQLNPRWKLSLAPAYARKKSRYHSPIGGKTRVSREIFGIPFSIPFDLNYEGTADGVYDNQYLDLPLRIGYQFNDKFSFYLGGQAAYLLKGSHTGEVDVKVAGFINVKDEPFDQSDFIRPWDYGALLGGEFALAGPFSLTAEVYVGLQPLFTDDFQELDGTYRNVYAKLELAWRLFRTQ